MTAAASARTIDSSSATRWLVDQALALDFNALPADIIELARQCLLDWFAVSLAACDDPLVRILTDEALEEGASPAASLIGSDHRLSRPQAALINGAMSHALDYDDVNLALNGHPTVALVPALLAAAEGRAIDGKSFLAAFVAGYETACRIGLLVAPSHYALGFHATATVGAFGAAVASAHLLRLDAERTATAMGIAGTQAAGLKSLFGTMCKPLHAGMAARTGLAAARLAARGFTARPDILECAQGFAATHARDLDVARALGPAPQGFHIRDNLFKYHAACYLTHAPMECGKRLRLNHPIDAASLNRIRLEVDREVDKVCNIARPQTGLEAKFSLTLTTAFALAGIDTAALDSYSAANANDPALTRLRDKVEVSFRDGWPQTRAALALHFTDGRTLAAEHDAGLPERDVAAQGRRIAAKFHALVEPVLGTAGAERLHGAIVGLDRLANVDQVLVLARR